MSTTLPPFLATAMAAVAADKHAPEAEVVELLRAARPFDAEARAGLLAELLTAREESRHGREQREQHDVDRPGHGLATGNVLGE
jgi:hypothetical protein